MIRQDQIEKVAGNVEWDAHDVRPSHSDIYHIKDLKPVPSIIIACDVSVPPWEYDDGVDMIIPRAPQYAPQQDGIAYSPFHEIPLAMNEVEVPDSELVEFNEKLASLAPAYKKLFYHSAANLSAFDDAASYVEAALRDGLDIGLEMDSALLEAYVPISRLGAVETLVTQLNLGDDTKRSFLAKITELLAEKTVAAMEFVDAGNRARRNLQLQKELQHARVKPQEQHGNNPPVRQENRWGIVGTRR